MTPLVLLLAFIVVGLGLVYYWNLSHAQKFRLTFSNFFLGGGQVGASLTHETNWGLSLAFANAFWYFTYLSYNYGLWTFVLNLPWCLSISYLGFVLIKYLRAAKYGTIHTFLGHCFGDRVRISAAIATTIGYLLNCGFEIFYSARIIAQVVGHPASELAFALVLALFCGLYCMTGGYRANLVTDAPQNKFAVIALGLLTVVLLYAVAVDPKSADFFTATSTGKNPTADLIVGVLIFTSLFNLVDMANWQSVAANTNQNLAELPKEKLRELQWSFYKSAIKQIFAPGLMGALVGTILRMHSTSLGDEQLYPKAFELSFGSWHPALAGLFIGIILLGFISATLSSADNYILASAQTIVNDIVYHRRYHEISAMPDKEEREAAEELFVRKLRRRLPAYSMAIVLLFASLFYFLPDYVFGFQFIMYGSALCLFPSLWFAMRRIRLIESNDLTPLRSRGSAAFFSIVFGVLAAIVPFVLASTLLQYDPVSNLLKSAGIPARADFFQNLAPLFAVTVSFVTFLALGGTFSKHRV